MRPLKHHPPPQEKEIHSQFFHLPIPTSPYPTHIKARANQAATCFLQGGKKEKRKKKREKKKHTKEKKKEHMKEAQSPKNVESGEICTGVIPVLTTVGQCMFIHTGHHHYLH